jgi:hypothetical protein
MLAESDLGQDRGNASSDGSLGIEIAFTLRIRNTENLTTFRFAGGIVA